MPHIEDFGDKIGGARKDLWAAKELAVSDLLSMTPVEKKKFVKRDNIWKKADTAAKLAEGIDPLLIFWQEKIRVSLPPFPEYQDYADRVSFYVEFVTDIRDKVMNARKAGEVLDDDGNAIPFMDYVIMKYIRGHLDIPYSEISYLIYPEFSRAFRRNMRSYEDQMKEDGFGMTKDEYAEKKAFRRFEIHQYTEDKTDAWMEPVYSQDNSPRLWIRNSNGVTGFQQDSAGNPLDPHAFGDGDFLVANMETHCIHASGLKREEAKKMWIMLIEQATKDILEELVAKETHVAEAAKEKKEDSRTSFIPKQLENVRRTGNVPDYTGGKHITGDDYLKAFCFKGGEFGNWLNEKDRQASLDMGYNALHDLAWVLGIDPCDISLGGRMSIAFGSRGHGYASAHFEPERNVINLTKMKGAGHLAHEWAHALDFFLANLGGVETDLASETIPLLSLLGEAEEKYPKTFVDLILSMSKKELLLSWFSGSQDTDFFKGCHYFDEHLNSSGHAYWWSPSEMFARLFDCYIADKLAERDVVCDYLTAHSGIYHITGQDGQEIYAIPLGEERRLLFQLCDLFFDELKSLSILHAAK